MSRKLCSVLHCDLLHILFQNEWMFDTLAWRVDRLLGVRQMYVYYKHGKNLKIQKVMKKGKELCPQKSSQVDKLEIWCKSFLLKTQ